MQMKQKEPHQERDISPTKVATPQWPLCNLFWQDRCTLDITPRLNDNLCIPGWEESTENSERSQESLVLKSSCVLYRTGSHCWHVLMFQVVSCSSRRWEQCYSASWEAGAIMFLIGTENSVYTSLNFQVLINHSSRSHLIPSLLFMQDYFSAPPTPLYLCLSVWIFAEMHIQEV